MRLLAWFVAFVALWVAIPAWAARVELRLDAEKVHVGQTFGLAVRVVDGSPTSVPQIAMPEGLRIAYHTQQSNAFFDLTRRKSTRITEYQYRVTALAEGTYELGPYPVELGADSAATNARTLVVLPRTPDQKSPIEATAGFDKEKAWEGEVVVYRYELRTRMQPMSSRWILPDFDGFVAPRDGDRPRRQYTIDDPEGTTLVDETAIPLVATGTGRRDIREAVVRVDIPVDDAARKRRTQFDEMFGLRPSRTETVATTSQKIEIRELPPPPPGFSGLVGDFTFESRVDRERAPVGSSVEWTVRIQGDGSLEGFALPPLAENEAFQTYDGGPGVHARVVDDDYLATGDFPRVLVPTREGRLEVPPLEIITFSPSRGEYVRQAVMVPPIDVVPGGDVDAAVESFARPSEGMSAPTEPEDIRPIYTSGPDQTARLGPALPVLMGVAAAPGAWSMVLGFLVWLRRRREASVKVVDVTPRQRLERLPADPKERLAALDAAVRDAMARREGVTVGALQRDAAMARLPDALRVRVAEATQGLDRTRFADDRPTPELEARVREIVLALEKK